MCGVSDPQMKGNHNLNSANGINFYGVSDPQMKGINKTTFRFLQ